MATSFKSLPMCTAFNSKLEVIETGAYNRDRARRRIPVSEFLCIAEVACEAVAPVRSFASVAQAVGSRLPNRQHGWHSVPDDY